MLDIVDIAHPAFILLRVLYIAYIADTWWGVDSILASVIVLPRSIFGSASIRSESRSNVAVRHSVACLVFFGLLFITEVSNT